MEFLGVELSIPPFLSAPPQAYTTTTFYKLRYQHHQMARTKVSLFYSSIQTRIWCSFSLSFVVVVVYVANRT